MPELPEVETIKRGLQKKIVGLKIKKVEILAPKSFQGELEDMDGKEVVNIWRRAKMLGIELSQDITLLIHLKMSGQLIWVGEDRFIGGHPTVDMTGELPNKSTRVIFTFSDNSKLFFNDQRRFGWIKILKGKKEEWDILNKLGPEPLEREFTWQILKSKILNHKSQPIKVAILDQNSISGIGNIYACEACFNAKLDPRTKVSSLSDLSYLRLHQGIIKALEDGVKYGGSTKTHFVDAEGRKGLFLDHAYVYGKDKTPCKICGTEIKKIKLGGRGTFFCPTCQKV